VVDGDTLSGMPVLTLSLSLSFSLALLGAVPTTPAACVPLVTADQKQITTPHHTYVTRTRGSQTETNESITTADATYIQVHGQWRRSPLTPQALLAQKQENIKNAKTFDCQLVRDEPVDGTPATLYRAHTVVEDSGTSDVQIWVAKSTGLPLKEEIDADPDDPASKSHTSMRFDYTNIQAPPGVK
jgi:hypothetical protein